MRIGLAEKLAGEARHAVTRQKNAGQHARACAHRRLCHQHHQQGEKAKPFKPGLGLSNTRDRFRHLYGERAQLTLQPLHADGSGCRSDVLIHDSP